MPKNNFIYLMYAMILTSCTTGTKVVAYQNDSFNLELAYRWAPVHYQDTDDTNPKADYITKFDYDGNYLANDNWENLSKGDLSAYAYYSVVETSTHWFITYSFYHPRDWEDWHGFGVHENDIEGLLAVIKKGVGTYGSFVAMLTTAHGGTFSAVPNGSSLTRNLTVFNENVPSYDGFNGHVFYQPYDGLLHPVTAQNPKGHGLYAFPNGNFGGNSDEDGIIYYPSKTVAELPSSGNDRNVKYKLINMFNLNLWSIQFFESSEGSQRKTFAKWGCLNGNAFKVDPQTGMSVEYPSIDAMMPWVWDFSGNYPKYRGLLALDPALVVKDYFNGLGNFSLIYTKNKYLYDLRQQGFNDNNKPFGWFPEQMPLSELYSKLPQ
jgi:hypothetical protein